MHEGQTGPRGWGREAGKGAGGQAASVLAVSPCPSPCPPVHLRVLLSPCGIPLVARQHRRRHCGAVPGPALSPARALSPAPARHTSAATLVGSVLGNRSHRAREISFEWKRRKVKKSPLKHATPGLPRLRRRCRLKAERPTADVMGRERRRGRGHGRAPPAVSPQRETRPRVIGAGSQGGMEEVAGPELAMCQGSAALTRPAWSG